MQTQSQSMVPSCPELYCGAPRVTALGRCNKAVWDVLGDTWTDIIKIKSIKYYYFKFIQN